MKSYLTALLGNKIINLYTDDESAGMIFEGGSKLSVFNRHKFSPEDSSNFVGVKVESVVESEDKINIGFHNGGFLEIYLDNQSWSGPEAVELILADGQIIVWS